ncbi:ABC transporter permease [Cellulomonas fimi]|uniref:ABC-2 type transporter n=1 Tax=Cellulomonas fimi (strain ATCC 484 / DSM 20113 / JCM 1341 / CCUG 24087 / LMG 16345 / NBRC 15513 / NCIMB 8980 / NCTC 7547 / NRS-133) TaxID=590998 RepID=F4H5P8_CELFA|nr:ABC transporter permease [Cellulomonas fimi]AEE44372.1 ABC-2 type transporter [Cellulomonas fimi ATCC 484]NNH08648.1 ABC transporter permease [Cellulomonas fimi]VEH26226.1 Daunorubicin/doxorubicin resistance ABC transporter permease protein drrB [Cellulomonas fimi]
MSTSAPAAPTAPGGTRGPARRRPFWPLALLHARLGFLETIRIPIAVLGNLLFPALALLFFVVPQQAVAQDPGIATAAVTQLGTFAVMSTCLFSFGVGVAEDRALPFDPFLRTLPAGAAPRLTGRVLNGLLWAYMALVPLVLVGALLTAASVSFGRALLAVVVVPAVAVPFLLLGVAIGYRLSAKAAIAVVQAVLFPLAFAGGLFMPPEVFPGWLDAVSKALPSRAARDLAIQATTGYEAYALALPVILAWTALFAVLAVLAYRSDEGRRFR